MNQEELNREWIHLAPAWIREAREGVNPTRTGLLDEPMLQACGDVRGLRVLECGCGEGRFCRMLIRRGAEYVLGLDLCAPMVEAARELESERDEYRVEDVQDLGFLDSESFDLHGGRFVVANLHPMRSAVGAWHRAENGEKLHVILDRYFEEDERQWKVMGHYLTNFHRSISTYVRGFLTAGFSVVDVIEPTVTEEQLDDHPDLDDELRVPNFIIYVLKKP
jgi:SAM-dependent methyltransferase